MQKTNDSNSASKEGAFDQVKQQIKENEKLLERIRKMRETGV